MPDLSQYRLEGSPYEYDESVVMVHTECGAFKTLSVYRDPNDALLSDAVTWAEQHDCAAWAAPCSRCGHKMGLHAPTCSEYADSGSPFPCDCAGP